MASFTKWCRFVANRQVFNKTRAYCFNSCVRTFADTPDVTPITKEVKTQNTSASEERIRVRRARHTDTPRVLRFVREHAREAWPGLAAPPSAPHLLLCDYVARALAQGHSMLAEQQQAHRGWSQVRGVALAAAVCPWDAQMVDSFARCMRCAHSRRLMAFTAHCLRAPALHEKYKVKNILQVALIVPQSSKSSEIISTLAKNAIKRGREVGFHLIRFDVTSETTAKILEDLELKKEWQLSYNILPDAKDTEFKISAKSISTYEGKTPSNDQTKPTNYKYQVSVYTASISPEKCNKIVKS